MRDIIEKSAAYSALVAAHGIVVLLIAVGVVALTADFASVVKLAASFQLEHFSLTWELLALHLLLAATIWGMIVGLYRYARRRIDERRRKRGPEGGLTASRGTVIIETLIVMPFLLLLISGIAQLTMLNVAGLLSDLAAYQGARTAWIWSAEADSSRSSFGQDEVRLRARIASAFALAPTASADFAEGRNTMGISTPPETFSRARAGVSASMGIPNGSAEYQTTRPMMTMSTTRATSENLTFAEAFDSETFHMRAVRKPRAAFLALDDYQIVEQNGEIGVHFTYDYNLLFPWFGYMFAESGGGLMGRPQFSEIEREFMFPQHPTF